MTPTFELSDVAWSTTHLQGLHVRSRGRVSNSLDQLDLHDSTAVVEAVRNHGGALIVSTDETITIYQDLIRSFPVLFTTSMPTIIGDAPHSIARHRPLSISAASAREFEGMGFVSGEDTLYEGLKQTVQGTTTTIDIITGTHTVDDWGRWTFDSDRISDPDELGAVFDKALDEAMKRLVRESVGSTILIPLSGGLDSRLLISWLVAHDVKNVVSFTYGVAGSRESEISRQIATAAQYPWEFVQYDSKKLLERWHAPQTEEFLRYSYGGVALPHIQDWYALEELLTRGIAQEGDIVVPGHTIVGNMHDEDALGEAPLSLGRIAQLIAGHHYDIQGTRLTPENDPKYLAKLREFISSGGYDGSATSVQDALESYNVRERQAKYINNSMRAYEYYGLRWSLPMIDAPVWDAWRKASSELSLTRDWYRDYVTARFEAALGDRARIAPYFQPIAVEDHRRDQIKKLLAATGLLTLANRAFATYSSLHDGTALDLYVTNRSRMATGADLMRGRKLMGFWTSSFLADEWSRGARVMDLAEF